MCIWQSSDQPAHQIPTNLYICLDLGSLLNGFFENLIFRISLWMPLDLQENSIISKEKLYPRQPMLFRSISFVAIKRGKRIPIVYINTGKSCMIPKEMLSPGSYGISNVTVFYINTFPVTEFHLNSIVYFCKLYFYISSQQILITIIHQGFFSFSYILWFRIKKMYSIFLYSYSTFWNRIQTFYIYILSLKFYSIMLPYPCIDHPIKRTLCTGKWE